MLSTAVPVRYALGTVPVPVTRDQRHFELAMSRILMRTAQGLEYGITGRKDCGGQETDFTEQLKFIFF